MEVLRTAASGCYRLKTNAWGTYLAPTIDPLADTVITDEQIEGFEINPDVNKIPDKLWQRWISLCVEMTKRDARNLEVSCRLLRSETDPSVYRIAVPEQSVTVASVRVDSFDKAIDIETGEVILQWPPEGWRPCGSSHSHNTMDSFFSGTDDAYELGDPGLHIVVGNINAQTGSHTLKASVTANKRRFLIEPDSVLGPEDPSVTTYHPSVIDVIKLPGTAVLTAYRPWGSPQPFTVPSHYAPVSSLAGDMQDFSEQIDAVIAAGRQRGLDELQVLAQLKNEIDDRIEDEAIWNSSSLGFNDPFYYEDSLAWTV